jgi:EmrB/QacA subfamily drug resistance transporter
VVQAVGGALISSNTMAILADAFPPGKRGMAMGAQAILVSGGAATGPVLGGVRVTRLGWRSVFWVNVPLGLLALVLGARLLPDLASHRTGEPVDWPGAALLVGGLTSLLLGLTRGPDWGWRAPATLGCMALGLLVLAAFLAWETRVEHPLIDLTLLEIPTFRAAQASGILATLSYAGLTFLLPFYWQGIRGLNAEEAGLMMMPLPLTFMVTSPVAGWLSDLVGSRAPCTLGMLVAGLSLGLLGRLTPETPLPQALGSFALFGLGLGLFMAPNNSAVMSSVPPQRRGVASGLLATVRYMGQSLGVAIGGTVLAHAMEGRLPPGIEALPSPGLLRRLSAQPALHQAYLAAFTGGFATVCRGAAGMAALAALVSWTLRPLAHRRGAGGAAQEHGLRRDRGPGTDSAGQPR